MRAIALGLALLALLLCGGAALLDRHFPPDLSRLHAAGTEILDRQGRTLALLPAPGGVWRFRTTTEDVSPDFVALLVRTEDRNFWSDAGVEPLALLRAAGQFLRAGKIVSGGSTLSMQAARLLDPRPRTLAAKLIQIVRALQLEERFSKRDILGIWLTLAPYGGNLEGVRAGAAAWFGTDPRTLDPAQAALLVAIPRRPEALRPDRHPAMARALRGRVLNGSHDRVLAEAADAPMPARRLPFPAHAMQAVRTLPRSPVATTTLDLPLQEAVERLAADRLASLPPRVSLAMLIADLRTRDIRALYAGVWGDEARSGALDLTRAIRSPGSTLKPALYALAFQDGLATPETRLADLPTHFGGYAPDDFDFTHQGNVTTAEALRRSLNLPAVLLMQRLGPTRFAASLAAAGVTLRLPPNVAPSLPLALGGAGVTMRQLGAIYAALGTDGEVTPLRLLPGQENSRRALVQPSAARLVADILTEPFPSGGPPGVAWKTGTSWGGRDSWALGFDHDAVAAVWVGRPDGTSLPAATGRDLALPMLARLFGLLPASARAAPPRETPMAEPDKPADPLRLLFPPPGAVLGGDGPVPLHAMGGRRPLTFLVDGARVPDTDATERSASWTPPGPGFFTLSVLDADGASARANIRIR